jgi:hypothetical protein
MDTATMDPPAAETQPGDPPVEPPADPPQEPTEPQEPEQPAGPDPEGQQPEEPSDEITLEGTGGQLSLKVGGKAPTSSQFKLVGGAIGVDGQFAKGDVVVLRVEVRVGAVAFEDKIDSSTGQPIGCTRTHKARVVGAIREA